MWALHLYLHYTYTYTTPKGEKGDVLPSEKGDTGQRGHKSNKGDVRPHRLIDAPRDPKNLRVLKVI